MGKIKMDLQAALEKDPAARNKFEIFFTYGGFKALYRHRFAHWFYNHGMKYFAKRIAAGTRRKTGIDIHPAAKIAGGVFIDHGVGVVIGETVEIGANVLIYQGVTLGGTGKDTGKRHPTIQDNVMISAGAKVLGPIIVGHDSKIGAGSVVPRRSAKLNRSRRTRASSQVQQREGGRYGSKIARSDTRGVCKTQPQNRSA